MSLAGIREGARVLSARGAALWAGTVGGMLSAFVKWGTEIPFPPRTADRASPPAEMLRDLGVAVDRMVYVYSGHLIFWGPVVIHVVFSLVFAWAYCLAALRFPRVTLAQGAWFGLALTIVFHGLVLPAGHWAPALWKLPTDELVSETFGHVLWAWSVEISRRRFATASPARGRVAPGVWTGPAARA